MADFKDLSKIILQKQKKVMRKGLEDEFNTSRVKIKT